MSENKDIQRLAQGVDDWNAWRADHPEVKPDLNGVHLDGQDLAEINLRQANLNNANLTGVDLSGADLSQASINNANLRGVNLHQAHLNATLFIDSNLRETILDEAELSGTDFTKADLRGTSLNKAKLFEVVFADTFLSHATGLATCIHEAPSSIDSRTLSNSGSLPKAFLRGCGLPDWLIEAYVLMQPDLTNDEIVTITYQLCNMRIGQVVQVAPLFISYSHDDTDFVEAIEVELNARGIRYWRDVRHATAGRLEKVVDRAIRLNPTVLLVLSKSSVNSDWVEHEARVARKLEKELQRDVLCPVALDDSWKTSRWPARLREQIQEYNILDFSEWKDSEYFRVMFERLLTGLSLEYGPK